MLFFQAYAGCWALPTRFPLDHSKTKIIAAQHTARRQACLDLGTNPDFLRQFGEEPIFGVDLGCHIATHQIQKKAITGHHFMVLDQSINRSEPKRVNQSTCPHRPGQWPVMPIRSLTLQVSWIILWRSTVTWCVRSYRRRFWSLAV